MQYHLLCIGIKDYLDANPLSYSSRDAKLIYKFFSSNLINIGYSKLLLDNSATKANISVCLQKDLPEYIKKDDVFILYFSGHGTTNSASDGSLQHYIVPYDGNKKDVNLTCISVTDIYNAIKDLPTKHKYILVDSCYSGSIASSKGIITLPEPKDGFNVKQIKSFINSFQGSQSVIMTSCTDSEVSYEDAELQQGVFTYYLSQALQSTDEFVIKDLHTPVTVKVKERCESKGSKYKQTPHLVADCEGVFSFPIGKNKVIISPTQLDIDLGDEDIEQQNQDINFTYEISADDIEQKKARFVEVISKTKKSINEGDSVATYQFTKLCDNMFLDFIKFWDEECEKYSQTHNKFQTIIDDVQLKSLDIQLFGVLLIIYGNQAQARIYGKYLSKLLTISERKSGISVYLTAPELVLLDVFYMGAMVAISTQYFVNFKALLEVEVPNITARYAHIKKLGQAKYVFYCDLIENGHADKIFDYMKKYVTTQNRIYPLLVGIASDDDIIGLHTAVNFLWVLYISANGGSLWSDYGRYYDVRLRDFIGEIKSNADLQRAVADFMNKKIQDIIPFIKQVVQENINTFGQTQYVWRNSIRPEDI